MSEHKRVGRPPLSPESEVINVIVPKELMGRVRQLTTDRGNSIAWVVRTALAQLLEREGYGAGDSSSSRSRKHGLAQ